MKHLYFIRHGLSEMNIKGLYSGQTESPLSQEGIEQAKLAGVHAKDLHIDYIISSPLSRAYDTAKLVAKEIGYPADKIEVDDLLIERNFGSMEGGIWTPEFDIDTVADAETRESLEKRVQQVWEHIQTIPADNILVSSHGSTGRMLRSLANPDIPFHGTTMEHHIPNAQIIQLI